MNSAEIIVKDYIESGKLTESQGKDIMEKCASMEKEAFKNFFKKFLGRIIPGAKETSKEVFKKSPKKIGTFDKFKSALQSPEVKRALIASGVTTATAGTMGIGATVGKKVSVARQINRNYNNLIQSNPTLIREEDKAEAKKLVTEITNLSPLAATNDQVLKNYVMKGLKKKIELRDISQAANIREPESVFGNMMRNPPMPAQMLGQIAAAMENVSPQEKVMRSYSDEKIQDALIVKAMIDAYDAHPKVRKMFQSKMRFDPQAAQKLHKATGEAMNPEDWEHVKDMFMKISSADKDEFVKMASVDMEKIAGFWDAFSKSIPYMAGLTAIGAGAGVAHAGVEAFRTMKERKQMEKTFNTIKKNPDFKGKENELRMAFNTLAKFAPALATQPQTALAFVRSSVIDYPDPVTGEPMIDPSQIKGLADLQKSYEQRESRSPFASSFSKGFKRGFEGTSGAAKTIGTLAKAGKDF